tara:strand:+ start:1947 stop:2909 length:963 start_codon:yes stop_codon:yes gene_type:complete
MKEQLSFFEIDEIEKTNVALTLLCYGAGQDSTAILYKIMKDPDYKKKYVSGKLIVVFSETGSEHPETYKQLERIKKLCQQHDIDFFYLKGSMGFHRNGWENGLKEIYRSKKVIGMLGGTQMCTDNLKIKPIDRFLEHYVITNYNITKGYNIAPTMYSFAAKYGKIRLILGFAAGEGRDIKSGRLDPKWKSRVVERSYPLVDENMNRLACQNYINSLPKKYVLPPPSNCTICFFSNGPELIWLDKFMPDEWNEWVELEAAKIMNNQHKEKNNGVGGSAKLLPQRLNEAKLKKDPNGKLYGDYTDAELNEYKFSHGCVKSTY